MDDLQKRLVQRLMEDKLSNKNLITKIRECILEQEIDLKELESLITQEVLEPDCYGPFREAVSILGIAKLADIAVLGAGYAANDWQMIQKIIGFMNPMLGFSDPFIGTAVNLMLLEMATDAGLLDQYYENFRTYVRGKVTLPEDLINALERTEFPIPMLCKPNKITEDNHNIDDSYLVRRGSLLLGKRRHHEEKLAIDVLNMLNGIAISLDEETIKYDEPLEADQLHLKDLSRRTYEELLAWGNEFWFNWKFDYRGRLYIEGYQVNLQASDYKKASINFSKKEVMK